MEKNHVKNLVTAAMCVALGIILPMAFHTIQNVREVFFICGSIFQFNLRTGM